jgi:ferredoxin
LVILSFFVIPFLKEEAMKVVITSQCMGDRNCNDLCPQVFEYDENELKSIVKYDEIPEQYEEIVRRAAEECGADAIELIE